jgi:hypothetical protein
LSFHKLLDNKKLAPPILLLILLRFLLDFHSMGPIPFRIEQKHLQHHGIVAALLGDVSGDKFAFPV